MASDCMIPPIWDDHNARRLLAPWTFEAAMHGSNEALSSRCAGWERPVAFAIFCRENVGKISCEFLGIRMYPMYPYLQTTPHEDVPMLPILHNRYIVTSCYIYIFTWCKVRPKWLYRLFIDLWLIVQILDLLASVSELPWVCDGTDLAHSGSNFAPPRPPQVF